MRGMRRNHAVWLMALAMTAGCAASGSRSVTATSRPVLSRYALLKLSDIGPEPRLPTTLPVSRSAAPVSLDALQLYAQARAAMQSGERFTAIELLEDALRKDPDSFELNLALGQMASGTTLADKSLPALQKAAALNPDNSEVHQLLARLYLSRNDLPTAIRELRLAMATHDYREGGDSAFQVDYSLARVLQQGGYDLAALSQYEHLLQRLPQLSQVYRGTPDVMQMVQNPDLILYEMALLNQQLGRYTDALAAIEQALIEAPAGQPYAQMRVRLLLQTRRVDDARIFAAEVIARFGASVENMSLLREAYGFPEGQAAAIAQLRKMLALPSTRPDREVREISFALADILAARHDSAAALAVLGNLTRQSDYEPAAVARQFTFLESTDHALDAARLLVEASARHPDDLSAISVMMGRLSRLSRSNHLRLRDLQQMKVDSWAEAARLYWVARLADLWERNELARTNLEKSVRTGTPFAPSYRSLMAHYWARHDWDDKRKTDTSNELVMLAQIQGSRALAAELRGIIALKRKMSRDAAQNLMEAMRLGENAPEVQLGYASVQLLEGNTTEAERTLLKITEDYPLFDQGYVTLIRYYLDRKLPAPAMRALQRWLDADPHSPTARMYQATIYLLTQRYDQAEKVLLNLFEDNADNTEVLIALQQLYFDTNRLDQLIRMLDRKRHPRPDISEIAERLAHIYASQQRMPEALRVLDDLHRTAVGDSDLLYYVSNLYMRLNDRKTSEAILEEVLKIDPNHSTAANDLGYYMAEEGRDLDRAEKLVRIALKEEPDTQAFLDSLGWVMYKRGRFEEARTCLEQAIAQTINPDPVVLDHLGDTLYRLGLKVEAAAQWLDAAGRLQRLQYLRSDQRSLQLQLQTKIRLNRQNQLAPVAPLAVPATTRAATTQSSNL